MTVYDYIADSNPKEARSICESYGYAVTNPRRMGDNLKKLVNNEGEEALKSVMGIHPDKEILVEYFGLKAKKQKKDGCGCKDNTSRRLDTIEAFINAGGNNNNNNESSEAKVLASNTNTIIFASALVLAVAIIFKNDK